MAETEYTTSDLHAEIANSLSEGIRNSLPWDLVERIVMAVRKGYLEVSSDPDCFQIDTFFEDEQGRAVQEDGALRPAEEAKISYGLLPWFEETAGDFSIETKNVLFSDVLINQGGSEPHCEGSILSAIEAIERSVAIARQKLETLRAEKKLS